MSARITKNVSRPAPVEIFVNGEAVTAYEGETLATALLASGRIVTCRDSSGRCSGPFCNMGVCFECMIVVEAPQGHALRLRACLAPVRAGLRIRVPAEPVRGN